MADMNSRWWRAYDEAVDDPKLQCLSDETFRFWFNLCCVCSKFGGNLPTEKHLAFKLRMQERRVKRLLTELYEDGLIDKDDQGVRPHNWNGRQYQSDVSTPRVKRFRKRKRNVSETSPDTDTDTDTDSSSSTDTKMDAKEWFVSLPKPSWARVTAYDAFKRAPPKTLDVDIQIGKFAEFNIGKMLTDAEWRGHWERWCQQAAEYARRAFG
jgi:hypothetical protein